MSIETRARFGDLCRADAHPGPLLILDAQGTRLDAVPLDAPMTAPLIRLSPETIELVGEDVAAARVIAMRRRALNARDAFDRLNGPCPPLPDARVRTAMIFCAGLGTRLRPLTERFPKPAVPFFGAPLIRYSLALLRSVGVERVVINTHHLPRVMARTARAEAERLRLDLAISHEPILMDTAGGLRDAQSLIGRERFLLVNGDAFLSIDLPALIARHQARNALASLAVTPPVPGETFRAIEADPTGRVARIRGIGPDRSELSPWHFLGVHVIEPELFDAIAPDGPRDINGETYPALIARGALIQALPVRVGAWADLGTPRRYLDACQEILSGQCDLTPLGRDAPVLLGDKRIQIIDGQRSFIDPTARVAPDAIIRGAILDAHVEIGPGAQVINSVVFSGEKVERGLKVHNSLFPDCV